MILIIATVIAIAFFCYLYKRTVDDYFLLLEEVSPVINGQFKTGLLYTNIVLKGQYQGREVACGFEQLGEKSSAIFIKIKLKEAPVARGSGLFSSTGRLALSGGWISPKFSLEKSKFTQKGFIEILDKLTKVCVALEAGDTAVEAPKFPEKPKTRLSSGPKVEYIMDKHIDK